MDKSILITTIVLGLSGFILMNIKLVFTFIYEHLKNILCYSIKIDEASKFYYSLQKFVLKEKNYKVHNYYYRNLYDDFIDGESDENLLYDYGYLITKYNNHRILIYKVNEKIQNTMTPYKNTKQSIHLYSFNRKALEEFIEYIVTKYQNDKIHYYFNDAGEIKILSKIINKTFDNIFLNDNLVEYIINDLTVFLNSEKKYESLGLKYKRTYLFYGEAGTGKSSLSVAIANYTRRDILSINLSKEMNDSTLIRLIATRPKKSIILFEDIDCLFDNINRQDKSEENDKDGIKITLSCLLNILDGAYTPNDVIFILTTNHIDKLDVALKRDGRTDVLLEISKPNMDTKSKYVSFIKKHKTEDNLVIDISEDVTLSTLQKELLK